MKLGDSVSEIHLIESHGVINFLFYLFDSPLYAMLRRNLVALTTATTGMSHRIFSVYIIALSLKGANDGETRKIKMEIECCLGMTGRDTVTQNVITV